MGFLELLGPVGLPGPLLGVSVATGGVVSDSWPGGTPPISLRAALTSGAGGTAQSSA